MYIHIGKILMTKQYCHLVQQCVPVYVELLVNVCFVSA